MSRLFWLTWSQSPHLWLPTWDVKYSERFMFPSERDKEKGLATCFFCFHSFELPRPFFPPPLYAIYCRLQCPFFWAQERYNTHFWSTVKAVLSICLKKKICNPDKYNDELSNQITKSLPSKKLSHKGSLKKLQINNDFQRIQL
jgi:hypothetical protein